MRLTVCFGRIAMVVTGRGDEASCAEAMPALQAYLDGELSERTARRIARHLQACRHCGLEAQVYRDITAALARRGKIPADAVNRLCEFGSSLASGSGQGLDAPSAD